MGFSQGLQLFGTNLQKFKLSNTTRDVKVAVDISGWIHAISSKAKNPDSSFDVEKINRLTVLFLIFPRDQKIYQMSRSDEQIRRVDEQISDEQVSRSDDYMHTQAFGSNRCF